MVAALTDSNEIFNRSFRENEVFKQLTSRNNDTADWQLSVFSRVHIDHFPNPTLLVETLVTIAKNARAKSDGNRLYFNFIKIWLVSDIYRKCFLKRVKGNL